MSKNILFLTEQTFKERTGASNAIDGKQLFPMIKVAGDMFIQPVLGSTLYKRLQTGIEDDDLSVDDKDLIMALNGYLYDQDKKAISNAKVTIFDRDEIIENIITNEYDFIRSYFILFANFVQIVRFISVLTILPINNHINFSVVSNDNIKWVTSQKDNLNI